MNQPEKEYGYRTIPKEEYATFKRCEGLEFKSVLDGQWTANLNDATVPLSQHYEYRVKIFPGHGFEIVPKEERPKAGDEYTLDGITWNHFHRDSGFTVGEFFNRSFDSIIAVRRKLPIAQAAASAQTVTTPNNAGWVNYKDRFPLADDYKGPIEIFDSKEKIIKRFNKPGEGGAWLPHYTHWRKADNTFPAPEKPASQIAFEKRFGPIEEHEDEWKGWVAREGWKGDGK